MAKKNGQMLRRGETVHAAEDLPGVPAGTRGRVVLISGLSWIRYRVDFENGRDLGQLDRRFLARPEEWKQLQQVRQREGESGSPNPEPAA